MFLFLSLRYRISIGFDASVTARARYAACNVLFCARPPGCRAASSPEACHIGLGPGLIDEYEALGIGAALMFAPLLAPALDVFAILAESLGKPDSTVDDAWYDEAEDRLAAYDGREIPSVTLDEMIDARKKRQKRDSSRPLNKTLTRRSSITTRRRQLWAMTSSMKLSLLLSGFCDFLELWPKVRQDIRRCRLKRFP